MGVYLYARLSYEPLEPQAACDVMRQYKGVELTPAMLEAYNKMTPATEEEVYSQAWVWNACQIAWCFGFNVIEVCKLSIHTNPDLMKYLEVYGGYHGKPGTLPAYLIKDFSKKFLNGVEVIDIYWA